MEVYVSAFAFIFCTLRQSVNALVHETIILRKVCSFHVAVTKSKQKQMKQEGLSTASLPTGREGEGLTSQSEQI